MKRVLPAVLLVILVASTLGAAFAQPAPQTTGPQIAPGRGRVTPTPVLEPVAFSVLPDGLQALQTLVEQNWGLEREAVAVLYVEPVVWPDTCLGAGLPQENCGRITTPGYKVIIGTSFGRYEFHTDEAGENYRMAGPLPLLNAEWPLVVWERQGGIMGMCLRLMVAPDHRYAAVDCAHNDGDTLLAEGILPADDQASLAEYGAFEWVFTPPEGSADMFLDRYVLNGSGETVLTDEETQRELDRYLADLASKLVAAAATPTPEPAALGDEGGSGIEGVVTVAPICPVESAAQPCLPAPYQATITVLNAASGAEVTRFQTDVTGHFRVELPPGTYRLRPEPAPSGLPYALEQTVTVTSGVFAQVEVSYDSGSR